MLNIIRKGHSWSDNYPTLPEETPYTPMWSSGDGYQLHNLFIYRTSDQTATTTGAYSAGLAPLIYNQSVLDQTDWYDVTTGEWTPTVAGWWQIIVSGFFGGGGQAAENIFSISGAVSSQIDGYGAVSGTLTGIGYFDGVSSNARINLATSVADPTPNPQDPTSSFFKALYLRP